jgi:hypothetical protein
MTRKTGINHESVARILRTVPISNAFLFFTDIGEYTGEYATSLGDFRDKLGKIPTASIAFHFGRGDYERWSKGTLGDEYLAKRFSEIKRPSEEEKLRRSIQRVARRRLNQLERHLQ